MTAIESIMPLSDWLERAWLERYLDRQLTEDETNWFETYLMERPDLLEMVEGDLDLRDAIRADPIAFILTADKQTKEKQAKETANRLPISMRRTRTTSARWLSMAATLLLGVGIGGAAIKQMESTFTPTIIPDPKRIIYDSFRGEPTHPVIQNAESASSYALIEIGVPPNTSGILLLDKDGREIPLAATSDGFATFLVKKDQIAMLGKYTLVVKTPAKTHTNSLSVP